MMHLALALLAGTAATGAPTLPELKQATYTGLKEVAGPVTLKNGTWEANGVAVTLAPGFRVTGNLDGSGAEETAVVLAVNTGASGTSDYVAVAKRTPERVRIVAVAPLGDRVQIRTARIAGGQLRLAVLRPGPQDPRCCPGELADLVWTLAGGTLSGAATVTGRLSLDALAGKEWVLRTWKHDELAPTVPEVTMAYQGGRLVGNSGCNHYTNSVTSGASPGDVSVAPMAASCMASRPKHMEVEARFLKQLAAVSKIGFHMGQLALTYQLEGAPPEEMLFDLRTPVAAKP